MTSVCKLHGSIDWYDKQSFLRDRGYSEASEFPWQSRHPVFKDTSTVPYSKLVEGPCHDDDPLNNVYRVHDLSQLKSSQFWECTPLILSPSHSKLLYANPLKSLWRGLQQGGGWNLGLGVVGYSLPSYDEYSRQALYHLMRNYTESEWELELNGFKKTPARILDYRKEGHSDWEIRKNYSFMNWDRAELDTKGLSVDSINWLMS